MQTHYGTSVTLVDVVLIESGFGPSAVVPMGLINIPFFCPNHECRRFVVREVKRGYGDFPGFVVTGVNEFQGFLPRGQS